MFSFFSIHLNFLNFKMTPNKVKNDVKDLFDNERYLSGTDFFISIFQEPTCKRLHLSGGQFAHLFIVLDPSKFVYGNGFLKVLKLYYTGKISNIKKRIYRLRQNLEKFLVSTHLLSPAYFKQLFVLSFFIFCQIKLIMFWYCQNVSIN